MGFGDQLMAAGLAEIRYRECPAAGPVTITDLAGKPRWQPLWRGNPAIGVTETGPRVACGHGCLPYLVYPPAVPNTLTYNLDYRAADSARARIYLTTEERTYAAEQTASLPRPFILIEPFPADRKNPNRQWPLQSWIDLVRFLRKIDGPMVVQLAHTYATRLPGVRTIWSPTFRDACALMEQASCVVALEGGIPFATAALGVPTVALWGGAVPASVLAYPEHTNLVGDHNGCGQLVPCAGCERSWATITHTDVAAAILAILDHPRPQRPAVLAAGVL